MCMYACVVSTSLAQYKKNKINSAVYNLIDIIDFLIFIGHGCY